MITTLYKAIKATMVARGVTAKVVIGIDKVAEEDDANKIIFYPESETFRPPTGPGGNPRPFKDRWVSHHVHLWSLTMDQMDVLISQVVTCLHVTLKAVMPGDTRGAGAGSYDLGSGSWTLDTRDTARGCEYDFSFSVPFPILDRNWNPPDPTGQYPEDEQASYQDPSVGVTAIETTVSETIGDVTETVTIDEP